MCLRRFNYPINKLPNKYTLKNIFSKYISFENINVLFLFLDTFFGCKKYAFFTQMAICA